MAELSRLVPHASGCSSGSSRACSSACSGTCPRGCPPARPRTRHGSRWLDRVSFTLTLWVLAGLGVLLLVLPTCIVVVTSFTSGYSLRFPPPGYSVRWYQALFFDSPEIIDAFLLSLKLATASTAIATVLATASALVLARNKAAWARLLDSLFMSPLMLPSLALGLGILMLFNLMGQGLSFTTLIVGHVALCTPYVLRTASASYSQLDPVLLDCSRSLGASAWFTFRKIEIPALLPGIATGAFLAFMASLDNVALSLFLSDARSEVLPIRLWHIIEDSLDVRAAAASGSLIIATILLMYLMERIAGISRYMK